MDKVIDRLQRECADKPGALMLGGGLPADELFPKRALHDAFARALRSPQTALQYGWPEGTEQLRTWITKRLHERGVEVDAQDVIVTAGAQQALSIACEALLTPDARVAVDPETYPAALDLFRSRHARLSCERDHAAFIYTMPSIANPHGNAATDASRQALLDSGLTLVEDDAYAELRFDGKLAPPLAAVARDRVFYVGTLSKTLCPGLRVGWLVPPSSMRDKARELKQVQDLQVGSLTQAIVAELLARFDFDAHLAKARKLYSTRASVLIDEVRRQFPSWTFAEPEGGFSIFVETGERVDDARFLDIAARHGVAFDPGKLFRPEHDPDRGLALRLCYSRTPPRQLREAVARLARAWREVTAGGHSTTRASMPRRDEHVDRYDAAR